MELQKNSEPFQLKRRQLIELHQKSRRDQIFNRARKILEESQHLDAIPHQFTQKVEISVNMETHVETQQKNTKEMNQNSSPQKKSHAKRKREYFKNFQFPEWMNEVPQNLKDYYFCVRPIGQRVFIHFKGQKILLISLYGQVLKTFAISKSTYHNTLLEGYYLEQQNTLIVSDLLVWKQNPMSSSEFEFRLAWILNNLPVSLIQSQIHHGPHVRFNEFFNVTKQNLVTVYESMAQSSESASSSDGLLFFHKDSFYLHEVNPMVFLWKDFKTSSILEAEFKVQSNQYQLKETLKKSQDQQCQKQLENLSLKQTSKHFFGEYSAKTHILYTYERIPLIKVSASDDKRLAYYHSKCIIKFTFGSIKQKSHSFDEIMTLNQNHLEDRIQIQEELEKNVSEFPFQLEDFEIISVHEINTRIPDPMSKIVWKHNFANGISVNFEAILNSIEKQQSKTKQQFSMEIDIE